MDLHHDDQHSSDDECVFMGELTLKEVKKRLLGEHIFVEYRHRPSVGSTAACNENNDGNKSVKIIETHSTPNILSSCEPLPEIRKPASNEDLSFNLAVHDWDLRPDDSFLELEKLASTVSSMNISPHSNKEEDSFKHGSNDGTTAKCNPTEEVCIIDGEEYQTPQKFIQKQNKTIPNSPKTPYTPTPCSSTYSTPAKNIFNIKENKFVTPSTQQKTPVFKTPGNPVSHKKKPNSQVKKSFEHIESPVASYIKNSPSVPLIKNVRPRGPLPGGASCIPKLVKSGTNSNVTNKENKNTKLPSLAYKSAKETKIINIPDKSKLPQNQWAKQVASSIPRAMVIKHDHREMSGVRKVLSLSQTQENSFADLSLHQADLSVCTQKSAVKSPKALK